MRAVVQRVKRASVSAAGERRAAIERGFVVLLGVGRGDTAATAVRMAEKVAGLRLFEDDSGKMNRGLAEVGGEVLCISQFTLYGDVRRGRRPSFDEAAPGGEAGPLYESFCCALESRGLVCRRGAFGERMELELVNDGPVTLVIDSAELQRPRRS